MDTEEDPTELAGTAEADTMSAYAWTLEDEAEDYPATTVWERIGPRKITTAALVAGILAVVGAAVGAVLVFRVAPVERTTVVKLVPSVVTSVVTTTATPVVKRTETPETAALDDKMFVDRLTALGWKVGDPAQVAATGRQTCQLIGLEGRSPEWVQQQIVIGGKSPEGAKQFTDAAQAIYPNCG